MRGRPGDLATVLQNLLVNAAVHAPGCPVTVQLVAGPSQVEIVVSDRGPGLTAAQAATVFDRGVRGADSPGSGLGLYVARTLLRRHGGDVELRQREGGATLRGAAARRRAARLVPRPAAPALGHRVSTPTLRALSAVVVDDHRLLAQSIAISLRQEGVACTVAPLTDPVSLVAGIVAERPDVVLLDLDLGPGVGDGCALVAPLAAAGCRVLLVTATTDPVRLAAALGAGAVGVLDKTEPIEVLLEAATAAARGERVIDDVRERSLLRDARHRQDALACFGRLTARETAVLRALGRGENVATIAATCYVSEATVRSQVRGVLTKLGAGSQLEAVALAHRAGWLDRHQGCTSPRTRGSRGSRCSWGGQPLRWVICSVAFGSTACRSPTTPKSTSSKIGASSSLLTATMVLEVCMPARCWMAPEMPFATYSCGETVLPVWPTWNACGIQPESTAAREAPTAAPSESAKPSTGSKLPPVPRPPETTIAASVSSGRPDALRGSDAVIRAPLAASEIVAANGSCVPAPSTASGVAELGLTVMIGVPLVTFAWTVKLPANTDCVVTGLPSWATSTASVIRPESILTARRPAISLPSPPDGISTAAGVGLLDQLGEHLGLRRDQVVLDVGVVDDVDLLGAELLQRLRRACRRRRR